MSGFAVAKKMLRSSPDPFKHRIELKDLKRQPAANDNFELDPTDLLTEVFSLGEAAPAALFLYPMWAAASAYLKDPQYFLNKRPAPCGDTSSKERRRPLEWQPMVRPLMPSRQEYRNPNLTDAERQKLVEWLQSEKNRGAYRGAEGLPKGLPHDPKRDDTYATPIDLRNMTVDVSREDALPATERALPDFQQNDDHRRLTMGDAIPGRERVIGDLLQDGAPQNGARDFLAPQSEQDFAQDEQRGPSWIPNFRMGILDRGGKPPSGGSRYSAQFRQRLQEADIQSGDGVQSEAEQAPQATLSPMPNIAVAPRKPVDPKDRPRVHVDLSYPQLDSLKEIEAVFKKLAVLCPVNDRGMMDTSALRIGHDLTKGVEFQDGQVMTVQALLKYHEAALKMWSASQGKQPPDLEGTYRSEMRLMDVLRRVTGRKYLLSTTQEPIAKVIIKTDLRRVRFDKPDTKLKEVLSHAWQNFEATQGKLSIHGMQSTMVEAKGGERVRLQDLMVLYWQDLRAQLKSKKLNVPEDADYHATEDGLDMIYFSLFNRVRIRSRWSGSLKSVALLFDAKEPLPEVVSLRGVLSVLYKLSQTPIMEGVDRYPVEPKGTLVVVYDPRSGRSFNYEKLMYTAHDMLAQAKADAQTARVFTDIVVPAEVVNAPDLAKRQFPNEEMRRSLLTFVKHHRGYPEVSVATHVRRRSGERQVVSTASLASDSKGSLPASITQTYLASDQGVLFPSVMLDRFVTRLTYAEHLSDVRAICDDMKARGLEDAATVKQWVDAIVGTKTIPVQNALRGLPEQKRLSPIVLPLVFNDVYMRLQTLIASSSKTQRRWDAQWKSEKMDALDTLSRFDRMRNFVLDEETRLDALPKKGMLRSWRADSTQEIAQPDPWLGAPVPKVFADAMARVFAAPDVKARAEDVSRAFMQFLPLDDVGMVQPSRGITDTQDLLYATLTGRPLEEWSEATLTPQQRRLRDEMITVGQMFGMIQFNDYWLGLGVKLAKPDRTNPPTLRIYVAVNPTWAPKALHALNKIYAEWKPHEARDVQFKMTNVPPELGRSDASLFYTDAANQGIFQRIVALHDAHPEYFRAIPGPPTTAQYLKEGSTTGISVAEAPRDVRDSRNGMMSQLATTALRIYRERLVRGQRLTQAELIQIAAYHMQREGIDLERPGFYAGNNTRDPGWVIFADIFRQTDQYNAERDESLIQRAALRHGAGAAVSAHPPSMMSVVRFADQSPLMSKEFGPWAADPFTPDPTRAIPFTKAAPGPMVRRMSDGAQGDVGNKNEIPIGVVTRVANVTVYRWAKNVAFVRADGYAPEDELLALKIEAGDLPGYPELKKTFTLEDLRYLVTYRARATAYIQRDGADYPLAIEPTFAPESKTSCIGFNVFALNHPNLEIFVPWDPRWMRGSILDTFIGDLQ